MPLCCMLILLYYMITYHEVIIILLHEISINFIMAAASEGLQLPTGFSLL